jgi:hypothetical protein
MNPALVDASAGGGSSHRLYTLVAMRSDVTRKRA